MKRIATITLALSLFTSCNTEMQESPGQADQSPFALHTDRPRVTRPMKVNFYSTEDPNPAIPPTPCTGEIPGFANPGYFIHGDGLLEENGDYDFRSKTQECLGPLKNDG